MSDDRSQREQIERRLRATEERVRLAQMASGIGWFEWDLTTDAWEWTPPVAALFGFDPENPRRLFAEWLPAIFVDDVPKLHSAVETAAETGSYYVEFRVRHSDRSVHWIAGKGEATKDETGRALWLTGVYYEITDRKQLEARLLALNETLEARLVEIREEARTLEILNRTGAALASELSLERLVQMVTDAGVELAGAEFGAFFYNLVNEAGEAYTLYALSGAPREAFADFPMPRNTALFEQTFRGLGPVRSDDILSDPRYGQNPPHNGMPKGHLPVRSYFAAPVVSRSGEVLGGLFFGHSIPGIFTERVERILLGVAAQAAIAIDNARLYEASQRELAARRTAEQQLQELNETLEQRVMEEVERRQQAEDALRQAQKLEAVGQLTGGVAHDFNNLLTVIMGNLDQLDRILPDDQRYKRAIAAALRGASRAALLTHSLLAFSRRQPLAPEVVSVNKLVAGMSDLLRRTIGEAVQIETVLAGGLWPAFIDSNQLENALINLAVNARDAMPEGGKLTIETANSHLDEAYAAMHSEIEPGQYIGIFVSDTGVGMPNEIVSQVFEPFFTTKDIGQGTGLGLSQVYGFVKQSNGHVKIYSEVGHGTTVKLYLPRHRGPEAISDESIGARELPRGGAETVLVVEDDADIREYTSEMVRDLGYRVLTAEDGASALRLLDAHREVRLLFTDVGLPGGMNGRQLVEQALRRRPGLKVLYTTGYARNAIVHQGRLDPGVEVVFKPFTYSDLASRIRRVLDA
ncbi:MAG TPA: ATP-binding protein [Stellaceae bacterium]|nr:ATP-binding protein [Stellaceae bacterium]